MWCVFVGVCVREGVREEGKGSFAAMLPAILALSVSLVILHEIVVQVGFCLGQVPGI